MPRYIDADELKSTLKNLSQWGGEVLLLSVLNTVDWQFTADVAPRAEVAREIFEKIETLCESYKYFCEGTYAPELKEAISDLKKKYTEEK